MKQYRRYFPTLKYILISILTLKPELSESEILKVKFRWLPEGSKQSGPAKLASLAVSRWTAASAPLSSPQLQKGFRCCLDSAG